MNDLLRASGFAQPTPINTAPHTIHLDNREALARYEASRFNPAWRLTEPQVTPDQTPSPRESPSKGTVSPTGHVRASDGDDGDDESFMSGDDRNDWFRQERGGPSDNDEDSEFEFGVEEAPDSTAEDDEGHPPNEAGERIGNDDGVGEELYLIEEPNGVNVGGEYPPSEVEGLDGNDGFDFTWSQYLDGSWWTCGFNARRIIPDDDIADVEPEVDANGWSWHGHWDPDDARNNQSWW